jgi:hypothetical protein
MTDLAAAVERDFAAGRTTLAELGALIDAPSWLGDADVTVVDAVAGKLPVSWPSGGTVATIELPGGGAVLYLSLDDAFSAADVAGGLRAAPGFEQASSAVLREIAVIGSG